MLRWPPVGWLLVGLVAGCAIDELDYSGKSCPCPDGWLCRQPEQRCIRADATPQAAADWSAAMDALYLFEGGLGDDASTHDRVLTERPVVGTSGVDPPEGALALQVLDGALFSSDPAFAMGGAAGVAFGGWLALDEADAADALVMGRQRADGRGYALRWTPHGLLACAVGDAESQSIASAPLPSGFAHAVCRWDAETRTASLVIDGVVAVGDGAANSVGDADEALSLSAIDAGDGVTGRMDEVFFLSERLDDEGVRRIRACGVDGERCVCDPADPSRFVACNDAACDALGPCDRDGP
jgi:hypothetical protein